MAIPMLDRCFQGFLDGPQQNVLLLEERRARVEEDSISFDAGDYGRCLRSQAAHQPFGTARQAVAFKRQEPGVEGFPGQAPLPLWWSGP